MTTQLTNDIVHNLHLFVEQVTLSKQVWGLVDKDGWAMTASDNISENQEIMPFWSQKEYAITHCDGDWINYRAEAIPLDEFMNNWLPGMHEDQMLIAINLTADLTGLEVDPIELAQLFGYDMIDDSIDDNKPS